MNTVLSWCFLVLLVGLLAVMAVSTVGLALAVLVAVVIAVATWPRRIAAARATEAPLPRRIPGDSPLGVLCDLSDDGLRSFVADAMRDFRDTQDH